MKKGVCIGIVSIVVLLIALLVTPVYSVLPAFGCYGECTGCTVWGDQGCEAESPCCGHCTHMMWYGPDTFICCEPIECHHI